MDILHCKGWLLRFLSVHPIAQNFGRVKHLSLPITCFCLWLYRQWESKNAPSFCF